MRFCLALICCTSALVCDAFSGAWLPEEGVTKLIANRIEQKQKKHNVQNFRHSETYQSLLLEYGATENIALTIKFAEQNRAEPQIRHTNEASRIGLMLNTPLLASGLLPPFTYRLAKAALPFKNIQRDKRASLTLGRGYKADENSGDDWDENWAVLALADRISINRFHITQEVELDQILGNGRHAGSWLYRFSLGLGAVSLGTEAQHYTDYANPYQALAHSYHLQFAPPTKIWKLRLKAGDRRAPMAGKMQKNDYAVLEWKLKF